MVQSLSPYYLAGAILSLTASLFVLVTFWRFKQVRPHPSGYIAWRSMFDLTFAVQFIVLFGTDDQKAHCGIFGFLTQLSILGSQSWYFAIAFDLLNNLRNPFSDPASNARWFHIYVWSSAIVSAIVLVATGSTDYRSNMQICWIKQTANAADVNVYNWLLFFVPTLIYYFFSIGVMIYAGYRLKKGLQATFRTRQRILFNGARYVGAFCFYWTCTGIIYFFLNRDSVDHPNPDEQSNTTLYGSFAVTLAVRGVIDVSVWIYNQSVITIYRRWWNKDSGPLPELEDSNLNRALRKEVLIYSTMGICRSVDDANQTPFKDALPPPMYYPISLSQAEVSSPSIHYMSLTPKNHEEQAEAVPFVDYAPQVFRFLRAKFKIEEEAYKVSIKGDTEAMIEKYTEGRSGSFFYFSEDGDYIVKTLTESEATFLLSFLPAYTEYLSTHPHTLLTKFLGFHCVRLYTVKLYLVVMQSVFLTKRAIHERYDLKGSWIERHAKDRHGVLKDSDLNRVVHLSDAERARFLEQVALDAHFLRDCGIMDYSLLLGIHNTRQLLELEPSPSYLLRPSQVENKDNGDRASHGAGAGDKPFYRATEGGMKAKIIEGPGIYFVGIIDILQEWNAQKKCERFLKIWFRCRDPEGISAITPDRYAHRFVEAMKSITLPFGYTDVVIAAGGEVEDSQMRSMAGSGSSSPVLTIPVSGGQGQGQVQGGAQSYAVGSPSDADGSMPLSIPSVSVSVSVAKGSSSPLTGSPRASRSSILAGLERVASLGPQSREDERVAHMFADAQREAEAKERTQQKLAEQRENKERERLALLQQQQQFKRASDLTIQAGSGGSGSVGVASSLSRSLPVDDLLGPAASCPPAGEVATAGAGVGAGVGAGAGAPLLADSAAGSDT